MNFGLNETQQTLKNSARKFLATECPMAEVRRLAEAPEAEGAALWRKMAAQGWMGLLIPEQYGGHGMSMVEMAVVMEEMGYALVPGPYFDTVLQAAVAIEAAGSEEQKKRYLPGIAEGDVRAALASDESAELNGRRLFVSSAGEADVLVIAGRLDGEMALFVADARGDGITIQPMPAIDATRRLYSVEFRGAATLLARGAKAEAALEHVRDVGAAALAAEMTGGMQRVLELSVEYAKTRKQFGKPIGSFQAVQHHCADMFLLTEGARSASYYAAWALSVNDPSAALAVSVAKAYASDGFRQAGNRAIQVHGGMGFTWENDLHLYYRRAKASEIRCGDATFHRERIARLTLDGASVRPKTGAIAAT